MDTIRMGRRNFVAAAAAATVLVTACGGSGSDSKGEPRPAPARPPRSNLTLRGINYDTGVAYLPGIDATALTRSLWQTEYVRREIDSIADDLHCNAVFLLGTDADRLLEAATIAAERDLYVWIEPRFPDVAPDLTITQLGEIARRAEELRADHPDVGMAVGCELTLFMAGSVAGETWQDRLVVFQEGTFGDYDTPLNAFLADATAEVRGQFGGDLTYSSGTWETVDWSLFDVVGVDMYRDATNAATYVEDVRALKQHGKPVVITEFGCCCYVGADDKGGDGWSVVDPEANPPLPEGLVRDEQVQADYIDELLTVFEEAEVHGAFVYDFIEPDGPYQPDPRYDVDMASYGVATCYPAGHERGYATTGDFDLKVAARTIAARFR